MWGETLETVLTEFLAGSRSFKQRRRNVSIVSLANQPRRFLGTKAAAAYSGIPAGTLRSWRYQGIGPKFYKPRGRALYDVAELDEFIRSGIRVSSVRASREERNVDLSAG
jgi:hypothetical protein